MASLNIDPRLRKALPFVLIVIIGAVCLATFQRNRRQKQTILEETETRHLPDTLRVATLYSPSSYFLYRDEPMGYDYSLVSQFAREKGM